METVADDGRDMLIFLNFLKISCIECGVNDIILFAV